jgi:hypothetical protein
MPDARLKIQEPLRGEFFGDFSPIAAWHAGTLGADPDGRRGPP